MADEAPDRWAKALTSVAQLAGYTKEININQNISLAVKEMGDAELKQRLQEVSHELIDVTPEVVYPDDIGGAPEEKEKAAEATFQGWKDDHTTIETD